MKVLHSWLKEYVGEGMPEPTEVERILTFHAFEIDDVTDVPGDSVIDVKILPDRGGDALSHRGIARELATHLGTPLVHDPFALKPQLPQKTNAITLTVDDAGDCGRYMAALVTGVRVAPSPVWLKKRLEALGQRSINNVVDATNYVMLALGQPLHAYDTTKLSNTNGSYALRVRRAHADEHFTTLSQEEKILSPQISVIADGVTDAVLAVAGVKGGTYAAITDATTTLMLESAHFNPQLTRTAAQALKLPTDAAKRFENNLSPEIAEYALAELIRLITEIAGGVCEGYGDAYPSPEANSEVLVTLSEINARLGLSLTHTEVVQIFTRLGFAVREIGEGAWGVTAPFERRDVHIVEDVVEDVGRVYGYEHVVSVPLAPMPLTEVNPVQYYAEKIRALLCREGFSEIITSSFRMHDTIALQNALASDKGCLRSSLQKNLIEALDRNSPNTDLLGLSAVQLFEIGTVFEKTSDGRDVTEHLSLALAVRVKGLAYSPKDDARLTELEKLLEGEFGALSAHIENGVLECNLSALIARLPVPSTYEPYVSKEDIIYKPYSNYPYISRDIALWVPEATTAQEIEDIITKHSGELLLSTRIFDTFAKDGRISYAFRLIFQSFERTLTDAEVSIPMERITTELTTRGFEVR